MNTGTEGKDHELDQWLDAALARAGNVEPRPGLENRVLMTLQLERERVKTRSRWWWTLGAAGAAVAIVMWVSIPAGQPIANRTAGNSTTHGRDVSVSRPAARHRQPGTEHAHVVAPGARRPANSGIVLHASGPKLDQFPSPQPLADQEQILSRYVCEYPERAILVARAQTQLRKQEAQQMLIPTSTTTGPTSSDEPE